MLVHQQHGTTRPESLPRINLIWHSQRCNTSGQQLAAIWLGHSDLYDPTQSQSTQMFFGYKYELVQGVYASPQTRIDQTT